MRCDAAPCGRIERDGRGAARGARGRWSDSRHVRRRACRRRHVGTPKTRACSRWTAQTVTRSRARGAVRAAVSHNQDSSAIRHGPATPLPRAMQLVLRLNAHLRGHGRLCLVSSACRGPRSRRLTRHRTYSSRATSAAPVRSACRRARGPSGTYSSGGVDADAPPRAAPPPGRAGSASALTLYAASASHSAAAAVAFVVE